MIIEETILATLTNMRDHCGQLLQLLAAAGAGRGAAPVVERLRLESSALDRIAACRRALPAKPCEGLGAGRNRAARLLGEIAETMECALVAAREVQV